MIVRLFDSGTFNGNATKAEDGKSLDKDCLIVYEGKFQSLDGEVDIDMAKMQKLMDNHNASTAKMAEGKIDYKNCPPIQLDHSTSAKDTVGRLVGPLSLGEYTTKDGKTVKALYSKMRILGAENVEKAQDGRWTHLSIGADLDKGLLQELTITPFPAAAEASMLKRFGKKTIVNGLVDEEGNQFPYEIMYNDDGTYEVYCDNGYPLSSDTTLPFNGKAGPEKDSQIVSWIKKTHKQLFMSNMSRMARTVRGYKIEVKALPPRGFTFCLLDKQDNYVYEANAVYVSEQEARQAGEEKAKTMVALSQGDNMTFWQKLQKKVMDSFKLSDKEAEEKMRQLQPNEVEKMQKEMEDEEKKMAAEKEKMKKHLMDSEKMSDKDADDKLAKMSDDEKKEMSSKMAAKDAEEEEKKKSEMSTRNENLKKLSADMRASSERVRLAAVKSKITVRLSALKSQGKITPAEVKKIDVSKLSASNEATVDAVLKSYEDREPVIHMGAMGSLTGEDASSLAKKIKLSTIESEARMNMPSKRAKLMDEKAKMAGEEETNIHIDTTPHVDMEADYQAFAKMMDEGHDKEVVKKHVKDMMDKCRKMGGNMDQKMSSEAESEMSALAEEVKKMQTQLEEYVKLAEK